MRHVLIVVATIMLVWAGAEAGILTLSTQPDNVETNFSTLSETEITINIGNLKTVSGNGGVNLELPDYFKIGGGYLSGPESTVLPAYSTLLAVPENAELSLVIKTDEFVEINNFSLASVTDEDMEWLSSVKSSGSFYPAEIATFEYAGRMRDLHLARLTVYPVQYDYNAKTLKVHHTLTIQANYGGGEILPPETAISEAFYPIYNSLLANSSIIEDIELRRGAYWIIAPQTLAGSSIEFADWKKAMGYDVRIIPTSEIGTNPNYVTIGNFIRTEFENAELKPDYICLIGDVNVSTGVDTRSYGNPYGFGYIDSDNYYSFILGNDYFPDLFVGRISVTNTTDLANYFNKYYDYARTPYMDETEWYHYGTMVAGSYYPSPAATKRWCREMMIKHGYTLVDTFLTGYDSPYTINISINRGVTWVNYRGYGYPDGWTSPNYGTSNVYQLSNGPKYGVMTSIVCGTGDYNDPSVCLGEAWIRYANRGGAGFIGTSNHDSHTKWNNAIDCGIYWGLFEDKAYGLAQCELVGKMAMYYAFPEAIYPGGRVESYFNSYNDLGDPQLQCWTDIPRQMIVTHADSVAIGEAGIDVMVNDQYGEPIINAYVCLWESDNIFVGKFTDDNGHAGFQLELSASADMKVTVTEPTCIPYEDIIVIHSASIALGVSSYGIDDDDNGNSSGNGDSNTNPFETIELATMLKNTGTSETATGVTGVLTADDEFISIISGNSSYSDISPSDSTESQQPYVVEIAPTAPDGYMAELQLDITSDGDHSWRNFIFLPIFAANIGDLTCSVQADNNGDGVLDPGESAELVFDVTNSGAVAAIDVAAKLRTSDSLVQITDSTAAFGDITVNGSADNTDAPFALTVSANAYNGRQIDFALEFTNQSGQIQIVAYTLIVGNVTAADPFGPDNYGYYCFDNTDIDYAFHPEYAWIPIETNWQSVYVMDDYITTRALPFDVTYYGEVFDEFSICDNGYITLGNSWWANFLNTDIPSPQCAPAMIAPFWDDLAGPFYVRYYHDAENGMLIIGWNNVRSNDSYSYQTFEIIILDTEQWPTFTGDNEIIFQYNMATSPYSSSVGICNYVRDEGMQYVFNSDYTPGAATLANGRSIKFTTGSEYLTDIHGPADNMLPDKISLSQNYPNPFNPSTNIMYQLPIDSEVELTIYDILGRKVRTLIDQNQAAGHWTVSWDSRDSNGQPVSAGIYLYKLTVGDQQLIKKMILLK